MQVDFSAADEEFRAELRQLIASSLPATWQGIFADDESNLRASNDFCRELGRRGWLTQSWPVEYGGREVDLWRQTVLQEEMWAHNEPRGAQYMNVNWIGPAIMHYGTPEQKAFFLPRMAAGELVWAQGFSEPDAGSDLAALRCAAVPVDGGFVVTGTKVWISYGDIADYCFLLVRSRPGSERKEGLSVLLVDLALPGVSRRPIDTILGAHRQNEIRFDEVFVPETALLGPVDDGWSVAMTALSFERSGSARYARSARILGMLESEVAERGTPQQEAELVELLAFARATELVNYRVIALKQLGEAPRWQASGARIHNSLLEQRIAALAEVVTPLASVVCGADDRSPANGEIEAFCRNAYAATVTAGSYEIQSAIVAKAALAEAGAR